MMNQDNDQASWDVAESHPWVKHATWNTIPAESFPTAPGPMIYEGFIPEQVLHSSLHQTVSPDATSHSQGHFIPATSQYPLLGSDGYGSTFIGGPVQQLDERSDPSSSVLLSHVPTFSQYEDRATIHDAMSVEDEEEIGDIEGEYESEAPSIVIKSRGRPRGGGRGRGRRSGNKVGRPKKGERQRGGWNKGTKSGLRDVLDPGEEFNTLHKAATEAFIDKQDYDRALELILKAISINPEIYSAHVLLSEIYFARDDEERGIAALFSGAHANPNDPAIWHQLADVCLQGSSMDRLTVLKQASYCFQRLLQIDQDDYDARFQKAAISRELGHHTKALSDLAYLLKKMPHNSSILRLVAEICLEINDTGRAIDLYDDALEYQHLHGVNEEEAFTWADLVVYVDLIIRSDGAKKAAHVLKKIARWLVGRQDETFWDDFELDDREWDAEHRRRGDVPDFKPLLHPLETYGVALPLELRVKLGDLRLKTGHRHEALSHFRWLAPDARDEDSPLYEYSDLFLQAADALREVKEYEEALLYYEALNSVEACDDVDFWLGFGACSYVCEKREQALDCYERAKEMDPTSGEARTQLSKLYTAKGERDKALLLARSAIRIYENQIPRTARRKYERKDIRDAREAAQKALKDAYSLPKANGEIEQYPKPPSRRARERARRKAKEIGPDAKAQEEAAAATSAATAAAADIEHMIDFTNQNRGRSLTPPLRRQDLQRREAAIHRMQIKKAQKEKNAQERHDTVQQLYSTLSGVTEAMRDGDDVARNVWMDCAESMVTEFRSEKAFYPAERNAKFHGFDRQSKKPRADGIDGQEQFQQDFPLPSIETNVPTEYCGISFAEWFDIFLEYAMLLANSQEDTTECYTVIRAAQDCNIWYHDKEALFQVYSCWLACALALNDETALFNTVLRWFMREYAYCTDTYRLFGAMNLYLSLPNDKGGKGGQMNNAQFRSGPNQKFVFRQIVGIDNQLPEGYGSDQPDGPVPSFMRKSQTDNSQSVSERLQRSTGEPRARTFASTRDSDEEDSPTPAPYLDEDDQIAHRTFTPKELDAVLLTLYAQILYAGNSFPNALSYFYRAYNLDPKNSVVLLSIALCYMHQMFKRQNENRHMYLLQGWSFFEEYASARMEWAEQQEKDGSRGLVVVTKREIEFNRARCWQMLGMSDLAIRSYGRMLDIKSVKQEDEMDIDNDQASFSMEAAYAMVGMYALGGDIENARLVTEKYLIVE